VLHAALFAQTVEIQEEVTTRLWFQRLLQHFEIAGIPPWVTLLSLLALILAAVAAVWLWRSRRRGGEAAIDAALFAWPAPSPGI
jgi:hypothetical protein